jgi:hypothetical protein
MKKTRILLILAALVLSGCADKYGYKKVDVSKQNSDIVYQRFEQDFFKLKMANFTKEEMSLRQKYGRFYDDYVGAIMGFQKMAKDSNALPIVITEFIENKAINGLYDSVQYYYPSMDEIKNELDEANRHYQYYFPEKRISRLYTMISEFSYGAMTYDDSTLVVGLDMFLGPQYPFYESFDIPNFITRKLSKEYIARNCMEVIYNLHFNKVNDMEPLPLIESMINEGKKMYFLECMMPAKNDSIIVGYTNTQVKWCESSERMIWQYFNEKDLLYSTNFMEQKRYTTDGPSTSGMPAESPGKVGAWIGWQIVRKYMKDANGKISLNQLLNTTNKTIIAKAKYKP